jgi:predicted ATPase
MPSIGQEGTSSAVGDRVGLLERSSQLSALDESLDAVTTELTGRLLLVGGEAGVGKTTLLRTFCARRRDSERVLWGACEGLLTPGPLAPFFDLAEVVGGELQELVRSEARPHEVVAALSRELDRRSPAILVLEDLHWADEATLDVVRLLGRRISRVRALVLASYRDDELDHTHPLQVVLGVLAAERTTSSVKVPPLTAPAVTELAAQHGVDGEVLYRETNGNPFFVNEVLAAGTEEIPHTVRDAVLARTAHLTASARGLVEAVAIVPTQVEVWLLEALADGPVDRLDECLTTGVLTSTREGVAFRHELARLTIEATLPPNRRVRLHRKALDALTVHPNAASDLARLAHHAEAAGDTDAVLRFAPEAAARAASLGAHREAAAQYARALRFADALPEQERADLLERRSYECHLTDQVDDAIEALERALELHGQLGDRMREGDALRSLSLLLWCPGRVAESEDANRKAVSLLERLPPGRELALAYSQASSLAGDAEDIEPTIAWGSRATELAERLGDAEVLLDASSNVAAAELMAGTPGARETLERNYELAKRTGLDDQAGKAVVNLAWAEGRRRSHDATDGALDAGLEYCSEHGL